MLSITVPAHTLWDSLKLENSCWCSALAQLVLNNIIIFFLSVPAMQWQNTYWIPPYLISLNNSSNKFRRVITAARFSPHPQPIHQNVRLGREWCAISFLDDSRYDADVIRKKRRPKTPLTFNGGELMETLPLHYSGILLRSNMISTLERSHRSGLWRPIGMSCNYWSHAPCLPIGWALNSHNSSLQHDNVTKFGTCTY